MKKYLLKIVLFFAIVVVIDICFGRVCDDMVAHAKGGSNKQLNDLVMRDRYDVLIMGSSRARHHYDPHIMSDTLGMSCYNAGYDGNGIILADGIYSMIRDRYRPKVIVYDLTLGFDCYEYAEDQHDRRYISQLKPYYRHAAVQNIVKAISDEEYFKLFSGLLRYNCKTVNLVKENILAVSMYDHGYAPLKKQMEYEPTNYEEVTDDTPVDPVKLQFMEEFIQSVQADSVTLVFGISPRYKSPSRQKFAKIEELCRQYHIPLIDFYNDRRFYTNKEYFEDVAHMNRTGATDFTKSFSSVLKNKI